MPIEDADYFIRFINFPVSIPAFLRANSDGTYTMYLNPEFDHEQQLDAYEHELWHIIHDDLYSEKPIEEIENL